MLFRVMLNVRSQEDIPLLAEHFMKQITKEHGTAKLKYEVDGTDASGNLITLGKNSSFASNKVKSYKINDHGETDISNTDISEIPVINWKNYTYTPQIP